MQVNADKFAVLVAGSNRYRNYRHQADTCYAYQVLIRNGMQPENIIVMAFDDIATNKENPFPGTVYNAPTGDYSKGYNVYQGCNIDYKSWFVSKSNFKAILTGDGEGVKGGNGKVLKSTDQDDVFIYFTGHGAPYSLSFPNDGIVEQDILDELTEIFTIMESKKMFRKLVFYLESCYSGSMFEELKQNTNIYTVSAANSEEESFATYCPPLEDIVNNENMSTCLSDLFSYSWMNNTYNSDIFNITLQNQYEIVKMETNTSSVLQWGDLQFVNDTLNVFVGGDLQKLKLNLNQNVLCNELDSSLNQHQQIQNQNKKISYLKEKQNVLGKQKWSFWSKIDELFGTQVQVAIFKHNFLAQRTNIRYQVSSLDVENMYLVKAYKQLKSKQNYENLQQDLQKSMLFNKVFQNFKKQFLLQIFQSQKQQQNENQKVDFKCLKFLNEKIQNQFGDLNDASKKYLTLISNGKAQHIRLLLNYLRVPYNEKTYYFAQKEEWYQKDKKELQLDFPNLPYIMDPNIGLNITESSNIMGYLADKYGNPELRGKGDDRYKVDNIRFLWDDIGGRGYSSSLKKAENKAKDWKSIYSPKFQQMASVYNGGVYAMGYLTIADFYTFQRVMDFKTWYPEEYKEEFSQNFDPVIENISNLKGVKEYMESDEYFNY
ncbi:Thioredoxin-like fold [Pseudocohnilembus persalinus]|uniref:legumain n=1 Tax=Pseudocohnilembus persalinus TaxID=266149 RepID=A0A0V0R7J5_PSEPJ|nr:Thioredoxin-like fold [Pseudocohnilembus persalinus]|eukprot:KRX10463.1 Thioredoxin-like fold [Pseudocohnilembus persalinus]